MTASLQQLLVKYATLCTAFCGRPIVSPFHFIIQTGQTEEGWEPAAIHNDDQYPALIILIPNRLADKYDDDDDLVSLPETRKLYRYMQRRRPIF